jgi:hypothetical protein
MLFERREELLGVGVDAQVDDFEPGPFEHHRHQVLADVVDVALDGADDDLADRFGPGLGEERPKDLHAGLHRVGGEEDLGYEQDAITEVDADDAHAFNECDVQGAIGRPTPVEQNQGTFDDLGGHAVVEVVVHLIDEVFVTQRGKIDVVILISHRCQV